MARPATCFYWTARSCFATDLGGKRTVLVKGPKTKANRELALQRLAEKLAVRPSQPVVSHAITVAELVDWFLADCARRVRAGELKANTLDLFYRPYGRLIRQECGHWVANEIDDATILAYRSELNERTISRTTAGNRLRTLRRVLRWAKKNHFTYQLVDIRVSSGARREHIPNDNEIKALLDAAPLPVRDVLTMLLNCPMRPGDCFALRKSWVDLDAGLLRMLDSKTGQRLVPISDIPDVTDILKRRLAPIDSVDGFVFTTVQGRPWQVRYFAECVRHVRNEVGLGKHVVAYSCRHRWTTEALLNGVPLTVVRALRADKDVGTTLHYEHLSQHLDHLQQAARQAVGLPAVSGK